MNTNATQVAAFGKLVEICYTLGTGYNPSKPSIASTELTTLLAKSGEALEAVKESEVLYALLVNNRKERFRTIPKLSTRIYRAVISSGASQEDILEIKRIKIKFAANGKTKPVVPAEPEAKSRSSGLKNFTKYAENFSRMIQILEGIPSYQPNEEALKVASLQALASELHQLNLSVSNAAVTLKNARIRRNELLYGQSGIHKTAMAVKNYVYSVYGMESEQSRQMGKVKFKAKV
jgi:hypothetical protein